MRGTGRGLENSRWRNCLSKRRTRGRLGDPGQAEGSAASGAAPRNRVRSKRREEQEDQCRSPETGQTGSTGRLQRSCPRVSTVLLEAVAFHDSFRVNLFEGFVLILHAQIEGGHMPLSAAADGAGLGHGFVHKTTGVRGGGGGSGSEGGRKGLERCWLCETSLHRTGKDDKIES
jgi:hypothetical protein